MPHEHDDAPPVPPWPSPPHPPGRSPTWTARRHIPAEERPEHYPWLRLHEHLAQRHAIRALGPRRWLWPDADDSANLPLLLRQASAQLDRDLDRLLRTHHPRVTLTELEILRRAHRKASVGVDLAEYLALAPQQISRALTRLERAGLVTREAPWRDLRTKHTTLTDAGTDLLAALEDGLDGLLHLWLECLDEQERPALLLVLRALADEP